MAQDVPNISIMIDDILVNNNHRDINAAAVKKLSQSIEQIGLRHPITVRRKGDGYQLVAGRHRLEACKKLGKDHITASIVTMTNDEARLWEIAENLHRAELSKLERDEQIAEWISITEKLSSQVATKGLGHRPEGGINAAARELGIDKDDAHRAVRVSKIAEDAKEALRESGLDNNRKAMLEVASVAPEKQREAVKAYKPAPAITKADPPDMYVVARQLAAKYSPLELTHLIDHLADLIKEAA